MRFVGAVFLECVWWRWTVSEGDANVGGTQSLSAASFESDARVDKRRTTALYFCRYIKTQDTGIGLKLRY